MRGTPDQGVIKTVNEVRPIIKEGKIEGYKGVLTLPFAGTRQTSVLPSKAEAQRELDKLVKVFAPQLVHQDSGTGFSKATQSAMDERLAAI